MRIRPKCAIIVLIGALLTAYSTTGGGGSSSATCGPGSDAHWSQPNISGWTQMWGDCGQAPSFTFASNSNSNGGTHYVVEPPPAGSYGKTMTLVFTIGGSGTMGANDTNEGPPNGVSLYLNERGDTGTGRGVYADYRQFCQAKTLFTDANGVVKPGQYAISCPLNESPPLMMCLVFGSANASFRNCSSARQARTLLASSSR
jgi:hypothetical protein